MEKWHRYLEDPTLAAAILDRVVHNAYRIEMGGESIRKRKGKRKILDEQRQEEVEIIIQWAR